MQSAIERQVMSSVAVIHAGRLLASRLALECYALVAAGVALWQLTWVHKVFGNFFAVEHGGVGAVGTYLGYAFTHTHLATQLALVVAAAAAAGFVVDTIRTLARPHPSFLLRL